MAEERKSSEIQAQYKSGVTFKYLFVWIAMVCYSELATVFDSILIKTKTRKSNELGLRQTFFLLAVAAQYSMTRLKNWSLKRVPAQDTQLLGSTVGSRHCFFFFFSLQEEDDKLSHWNDDIQNACVWALKAWCWPLESFWTAGLMCSVMPAISLPRPLPLLQPICSSIFCPYLLSSEDVNNIEQVVTAAFVIHTPTVRSWWMWHL